MWGLKSWRRRRLARRARVPDGVWREAVRAVPFLGRLDSAAQARLRELATVFLYEKDLHGAGGLELDATMRLTVAAQACLPVLNLGLDYYRDWITVVVYPDEFVPPGDYTDDAGVVHYRRAPLTGEAWLRGPMILSWTDVVDVDDGSVVIHECAHKLDMLNDAANGMPPLHRAMDRRAWTAAFTAAYEAFCRAVTDGAEAELDPYGAETPAEFFAVMSEDFFVRPWLLGRRYPAVYRQLAAFYRQDLLGG